MGASNSALFNAARDSVIALEDLSEFMPQAISNIVWAYATAGETSPQLFEKFANHVVAQGNLNAFEPQALSNIVWAYATAGELRPRLFKQLADHIVAQGDLNAFKPQAPLLFQKLPDEAITRRNDFNAQDISNLLWAYAVANADVPSQFNAGFIGVCLKKENDFSLKCFYQLHQWQLWQEELKSNIELPQSLREKCQKAFKSTLPTPSHFQVSSCPSCCPLAYIQMKKSSPKAH